MRGSVIMIAIMALTACGPGGPRDLSELPNGVQSEGADTESSEAVVAPTSSEQGSGSSMTSEAQVVGAEVPELGATKASASSTNVESQASATTLVEQMSTTSTFATESFEIPEGLSEELDEILIKLDTLLGDLDNEVSQIETGTNEGEE